MAEMTEPRALLEMRGIREGVRRDGRARRRRPRRSRAGEICGARRPERRRQEHADGDPRRRAAARRGRRCRSTAQPYAPRSPLEARRAGVAMIYQELSLAPHLTVMENILLGVEPTRLGFRPAQRRCAETATRALARARSRRHLVPTRSSATCPSPAQQLVEIARAHRGRLPRPRARRADEQPRPRRRRGVCSRCCARLQGAGARDRLHLALHRGSEGDRRSLRRAARRTQRGRRRHRGRHARRDRRR